jgi:hypothetical protein
MDGHHARWEWHRRRGDARVRRGPGRRVEKRARGHEHLHLVRERAGDLECMRNGVLRLDADLVDRRRRARRRLPAARSDSGGEDHLLGLVRKRNDGRCLRDRARGLPRHLTVHLRGELEDVSLRDELVHVRDWHARRRGRDDLVLRLLRDTLCGLLKNLYDLRVR